MGSWRWVWLALFALACSPREQPTASPPETGHRTAVPPEEGIYYTFRVPRSLAELEAEVCFRGPAPARLEPPMGDAAPFLARANHGERPLTIAEGAIALDGVGDGDCVRYAVGTASLFDREGARRAGDAALLSPDWWLWKPEPRAKTPIRARFEGELSAVVPWPEEHLAGFTHRIVESCFAWKAQAAFGPFERRALAPPRARIDVYLFDGGFGAATPKVMDWLERSADSAAVLFGRFPMKEAQVLLVPGPRRGTFGYVLRGGGASATLLLPREPSADDLDWMATHELLHLALPPMPSEDAWLFEGLVTYLAAIARARSGMIDEREAWWELLDGFARGATKSTGRTTREESRAMHQTRAYWRVYWAGAAIALAWDVALHRRGSSIEAVLTALLDAELDQDRRWAATDLVAKLDGLCDCDVFSAVTARHLDEVAFPETATLTRALGLRLDGDTVALDDGAPERHTRDAIMRRAAPP
jgi:hypothetical protein